MRRGMRSQRWLGIECFHTFQQLRTDIHKLHLLPQITLVQLPNAGNEGVLFSRAAGQPPVYLLEMKVEFGIFLKAKNSKIESILDLSDREKEHYNSRT